MSDIDKKKWIRIKQDINWLNTAQRKRIELFVMGLYIILITLISSFHEPWLDEAQAWLIARNASITDILLNIPHYEGHTPTWHLVLLPFARSGIDYEIGIKAVSIIISSLTAGVILFKSTFPRVVRLAIPFTFFLFYQYGVISRNYCLMTLAFVLTAHFYKTRDTYPVRFVLSLVLLAASSSYGIVISAGIACAWLLEIWNKKSLWSLISRLLSDRRLIAIMCLFIWLIILVLMILPRPDTMAISYKMTNSFFFIISYILFIAPIDSIIFQCVNTDNLIGFMQFQPTILISGYILGAIFNIFIIIWAYKKRMLLIMLLPYMMFAIFASMVYISSHHLGIVALFVLFTAWVGQDQSNHVDRQFPYKINNYLNRDDIPARLRKVTAIFVGASLLVSIYWTISASYHDIRYPYGFGRETAAFLSQNQLDQLQILSAWKKYKNAQSDDYFVDTNNIHGIEILPYYNDNILTNLNQGDDRYPYLNRRLADNEINYQLWRDMGKPELLIGMPDLSVLFDNASVMKEYVVVKKIDKTFIWKDQIVESWFYLYMRKDLMPQFPQIMEIPVEQIFSFRRME